MTKRNLVTLLAILGFALLTPACSSYYGGIPADIEMTEAELDAVESARAVWAEYAGSPIADDIWVVVEVQGVGMNARQVSHEGYTGDGVSGWWVASAQVAILMREPIQELADARGITYLQAFELVAVHEMGHGIGEEHDDTKNSIMNRLGMCLVPAELETVSCVGGCEEMCLEF